MKNSLGTRSARKREISSKTADVDSWNRRKILVLEWIVLTTSVRESWHVKAVVVGEKIGDLKMNQ